MDKNTFADLDDGDTFTGDFEGSQTKFIKISMVLWSGEDKDYGYANTVCIDDGPCPWKGELFWFSPQESVGHVNC